jgi:hypothetical protein
MAQLFHGKISHADIPALADDKLWETPAERAATAEHGDLRGDLQRLAEVASACRFGLDLALQVANRIA